MEDKHTGYTVARMLMEYGVEYIFGIPGGQTLPLYDASYHYSDRLKHVLMRDERSAGHAACAYARISGKVGVCDATVGPGATNLPSALGEALNASTPVLAIVGEHPTTWINKIDHGRASQGIDQISMLKPVVKKLLYAPCQEVIPELVKTAFVEMLTGRPGPVALVIPADIFRKEGSPPNVELYIDPSLSHYPARRSAPDPQDVQRAAQLLQRAERPLVLVGGGVLISGAMDELKALVEQFQLPVVYTITGKGALPDDHPLNIGVAGVFANTTCAEAALREADLILIVGSKNSQSTSFLWTVPTPEQTVIHLDIDPSEVGPIFRTAVGLVGDARLGLQMLLQALQAGGACASSPEWLPKLQGYRQEWETKKQELFASDSQPIKPYRVMAALNRVMQPEDILICDAGFASAWGAIYYAQRKAGRYHIYPRGLAGLGFAVAAGLGAQLAAPQRRILTLSGDAAFTYVMAELAVEAKLNLPVVNLVLNNSAYGWVKWAEKAWYKNSFSASELQSIDFKKVAEGLGCEGIRVEDANNLEAELDRAFKLQKPVVVDVITDAESTPNVR